MNEDVNEALSELANRVKQDFLKAMDELNDASKQSESNKKIEQAIQHACQNMLSGVENLKKIADLNKSPNNSASKNFMSGLLDEIQHELNSGHERDHSEFKQKMDQSMKPVNEAFIRAVRSLHKSFNMNENVFNASKKFRDDFNEIMTKLDEDLARAKTDAEFDEILAKTSDDLIKLLDTFIKSIHAEGSDAKNQNFVGHMLEDIIADLTANLHESKFKFDTVLGQKLEESMKSVNEALISAMDTLQDTIILNEKVNLEAKQFKEDFQTALDNLEKTAEDNKAHGKNDESVKKAFQDMIKETEVFIRILQSDELMGNTGAKRHAAKTLEELREDLEKELREAKTKFDEEISDKLDESMMLINEAIVLAVENLSEALAEAAKKQREVILVKKK